MENINKSLNNILDIDSESDKKLNKNNHKIIKILEPIYENLEKTFGNGDPNLTYGEIEFPTLELITTYFPKLKDGYFYDLGCGRSKAVLYMSLTKFFKKCIGIDIVTERINLSKDALKQLKKIKDVDNIKFYEKSFLDDKFNYNNASLIYINNLCFEDDLNENLFNKIKNESKNGTYLFITKLPQNLYGFKEVKVETVIMSWSKESNLYIIKVKR
jgi:SAM-dependent methyltransferase